MVVVAVAALAGCGAASRPATSGPARAPAAARARAIGPWRTTIGRSRLRRAIRAVVVGDPSSRRKVLVVGCVHGDEPAGMAVTRALRGAHAIPGVSLWLVDAFNPDGCRAGTRQNASGVDLNRNSPWHWRPLGAPGGMFWSGPRPASEPETRAMLQLVRRIRPDLAVWYHQHAALVDDSGGDRRIERRYARLTGLPFRHYGTFPGSITSWENTVLPTSTAFVVELPAGRLGARATRRHVRAVLALAHRLR
ncbi:MAG: murein peptide amidase [Solirubrobacteraceae bacterium]|nr:murein peptide amidase [Solirubrobacteraceae bacterium]